MSLRHHRKSNPTIPMDSLSDVAFLLIIFFILTTSMQQLSGFTSEMPSAQQAEQTSKMEKMPSIKLRDGALTLDDQPLTIEQLQTRLAGLNLTTRPDSEKVVVLEATGQVNYQQYYEVMAAVSAAGGVLGIVSEIAGSDPMKMPRRRRREISVPTASMGDIAFLLTIFFMVCSNFAKEAGLKLAPPKAPSVRVLEESSISVSIDEEGKVYLQGQVVPDAKSVELGVSALLQSRSDATARLVMFKCDKAVDKAVFEPVLDAVARAGATIAAVGEKGKTQ